jgi:prevent-host-death family protein
MAQRMSTAEARKDFANLLRNSAAGERIKLTRYNKTVAVLISKRDLDELEDCQRHRREVTKVRETQAKASRPRAQKAAKRDA